MEYATFCGPNMASFNCECGTAACRGRVSCDHPVSWLDDVWGVGSCQRLFGCCQAQGRAELSVSASRTGSDSAASVTSMVT
jgi:hypothetical protein